MKDVNYFACNYLISTSPAHSNTKSIRLPFSLLCVILNSMR